MSKKLYEIISDVMSIPINDINDNTGTTTVDNWDSLDGLRLLEKLEQSYKVQFSIGELTIDSSVGEIKQALKKHGVKIDD